MLHIRGPEGHQERGWNLPGALSSPSPGRATKFGPVLSSCPYLVLQVIRLRHKRGCGPLAATRRPQREDGECQVGSLEASRLPGAVLGLQEGFGGGGVMEPTLGLERWCLGTGRGPWPGLSWELWGCTWKWGPLPTHVLQASRKAGTRGKAAAAKQAQRGSSNVFSMFEQAQIQEFKEVSGVSPVAWNLSWPLSLLCPPSRTLPPPAVPGWGLFPPRHSAPHLAGLQLH